MDVRLINPFVSAVQNVFQTMASTEVRVGKPYVKTDGPCSADVSGVIGLCGDATGCAVLSFPKAVAAPRGAAS
ncbi:MAG TPA: chemotaxis protein CheX [Phycisphaerae bacterium]|nr:chemotaxis protein CheX [Phycisphaerae bacterium]